MTVAATATGELLTALDIKQRLIQDLPPRRLLLWPPNLFAYTSYVLSLSGAYQLAVSPPPMHCWPPDMNQFRDRLATIAPESMVRELQDALDAADGLAKHMPVETQWTCLVRECGLRWRLRIGDLTGSTLETYWNCLQDPSVDPHDDPEIPPFLRCCWRLFEDLYLDRERPKNISELLCNDDASAECTDKWLGGVALISMHAIADDACVGWGVQREEITVEFPSQAALKDFRGSLRVEALISNDKSDDKRQRLKRSEAQAKAEANLYSRGSLATINPFRARILPKRHNPDVGITLRSLSSNLAFHRSAIDVVWNSGQDAANPLAQRMAVTTELPSRSFTMLLLPFPMVIQTSDFKQFDASHRMRNMPSYNFFTCEPERLEIPGMIARVLRMAQAETDQPVDMVVLPELALTKHMLSDVESRLLIEDIRKPVSFYIAGVWERPDTKGAFQNNAVYYKMATDTGNGLRFPDEKDHNAVPFSQNKHHRWQLNRAQIEQYGLSRSLNRDIKWWEAIDVNRRRVSFINVGERLTVCPLICEDLARQDPIADLIRHVGPSLVVTILMDGPQHKDRWSSRYAGILAEDPGSAVITLTSFGMVRRWNVPHRGLSRIVALWNDKTGPRELELEQGASGILLSLSVSAEREPIADGRRELHATSTISLVDVIQVYQDRSGRA
jgi:hypothetical protein